jgi:hypothetical protein
MFKHIIEVLDQFVFSFEQIYEKEEGTSPALESIIILSRYKSHGVQSK